MLPHHASDDDIFSLYETHGIILDDQMFTDQELSRFELALANMLELDADEDILEALRYLEKSNPKRFYNVCTRDLWFSIAGLQLITTKRILKKVASLMHCNEESLSPVGHSLFWNDPECKRLHYRWHQEAAYYTNMNNVISVWFPLIYDLQESSGPMIVALGSHKESLECISQKQENGVTQMEIPENTLEHFEKAACTLHRKSGVIFHQNLVHKTGNNLTTKPRLSGIIRYANLKAENKATPYWQINPEF
ncbi:phytanoyl-CoA dioxygenase family protein [Thalassolituus oleivorans]|jgi:hypothetical protein|uniref:phytanoyl-CoA dioxygenase family protein n=1 Tax=Thalassolituus oleivorans TaxID=187493 RepID=UPI0023F5070C|nr:phytanoyl-CoA dioxygenase family protein [Thalassolituus oleivorans]